MVESIAVHEILYANTELQIRRDIDNNSNIIFLMSQ